MFAERNTKKLVESASEILIRCSTKDDFTEWHEWRDHNESQISLKGAGLGCVNLEGADLSQVDLQAADLKNANFRNADLSEANLAGADLSNANLTGADLWKTDLKFAKLYEANLKSANLEKANLEGAELGRVNLEGANLWKANLKVAKFISVAIDKQTFIWGCEFDDQTVFSGGEVNTTRIEPRLIEHIKKNIWRVQHSG